MKRFQFCKRGHEKTPENTIVAATALAHADEDRHKWFKSLVQPDTKLSCCDMSDCHQTRAEWRGDHWYALVEGDWTQIPPNKIVQTPKTIDGEAYVCNGTSGKPVTIFCFVPPWNGF